MSFDPKPITLQGKVVRLEPLSLSHADDLLEAGSDPSIWRFMPIPGFADVEAVRKWIEESNETASDWGGQLPFAIILEQSNRAIGSTRYLDIRPAHRSLEIGWTWISPDFQRTAVNTEAKYLLLKHAFETLGAHRVQLKCDARNTRSQRAIERIGGVLEGSLRRHMIMWDGHVRDTVYYSIVDSEWPAAKRRLEQVLRTED